MSQIIPKTKLSSNLWIRVTLHFIRQSDDLEPKDRYQPKYFLDISDNSEVWTIHTESRDYKDIAASLNQLSKGLTE